MLHVKQEQPRCYHLNQLIVLMDSIQLSMYDLDTKPSSPLVVAFAEFDIQLDTSEGGF